jgi:hypothetical protein
MVCLRARVEWYNWLVSEKVGYKVNSGRAAVADVRAFFTYHYRPVKIGKRKIPKQQAVTGEHEFNILELRKMFFYADVRGKARALRVSIILDSKLA